ncbi:MAG: hypothetical protein F4Y02_11685 [Chloroflexi bacterium]|nr:hypothetical protein [Chloroflexota bacterium]
MPNTLQDFIDNLDETDRQEVDRLKEQFLAEEAAYQRRHTAPTPGTSVSTRPLAASPTPRK